MSTSNSNTQRQAGDDEVTLKELLQKIQEWWAFLVSKWLAILLAALIGAGLGLLYALNQEPIYKASTTFVLEEGDKGGGLGQYAGLAAMAGINLGGGGGGIFEGDNLLELYKSRSMIQKALLTEVEVDGEKQSLIERYISFNELREKWTKKPELANISFTLKEGQSFTRLQDSVMGTIILNINKSYLKVSKPDEMLSIIKASVTATDEVFAKAFNNQIVATVNDFYVQTKTRKSLDNLSILQHQTDSVRAVMDGAVYSSAASLDATPNLNPAKQVLRTGVQRSQFSIETNKAILSELIKNLELTKMTIQKETPLIQVIDEPVFPLKKERFGKAKGIVLGGLILGFLVTFVLIFKRFIKQVLAT